MPSMVTSNLQGNHLTIKVEGRFDFTILQDFRNAYSLDITSEIKNVSIDLSRSEHMDSSGMGLLLTLRKELGLDNGEVELNNCRSHIKEALLAARLDHFFKVN